MDVMAEIRKRYPQLAYLFNDPEIGNLLRKAVDPNAGFSPDEFQAQLYNTNWFKRQSQAQREWDILSHTDPGEANSRRASTRIDVQKLAQRLGIRLTGGEVNVIAEGALQRGWQAGGQELLEAITTYGRKINKYTVGDIRTSAENAKQLARSQYYVAMTHEDAMHWGDWMARGIRSEDDLKFELGNRAASRYRHLAPMLSAGQTMEDIFGGHRSMIAEELEIAPGTIDFTKGTWSKVLGVYDKDTSSWRPMSLSETQTLSRSQDQWWKTMNGRAADASMARMLTETFGKRGR